MKKKVLSLAIAAALAPGFAAAADVSGFADIIYTVTNDSATPATACGTSGSQACLNASEGKFSADGEVDFSAKPADGVTARIDVDLSLGLGSSTTTTYTDSGTDTVSVTDTTDGNGAKIEQAFFAWNPTSAVTVLGGVFNSPIGQEAEDAPAMNFTTHSIIYNSLNHQTALNGNNVAGVAAAGAVGPVTITGAFLNDIGQANEENSLALVLNASPIAGLDLEFGFVTHDEDTDGVSSTSETVGDVMDFNAQYKWNNLTAGLDYATYDKIADTAYNIWAGYDFGNGFGAKVRVENMSWENAGGGTAVDTEATTLYLSYQIASNLSAALEFKDGDGVACSANTACTTSFQTGASAITGVSQDQLTTLEFIATF